MSEDEELDIISKVYKMVVEHGKEGILQSSLWKMLNLTSRDGSRLAIRLERRGMVKRERVLNGGRWTYRITPIRLPAPIKSIERAPCITCKEEKMCLPTGSSNLFSCIKLEYWVLQEYSAQSERNGVEKK